jgi:hypothetical protein
MTTTTTNNKSIESRYLANYIKNVQQASKGTAAQYEYRLLKFEKYVVTIASEEEQQQEQQQRNHKLVGLLQPLAKFVSDCLKRAMIVRKSNRRIFTFFNELPSDDLLFSCLSPHENARITSFFSFAARLFRYGLWRMRE